MKPDDLIRDIARKTAKSIVDNGSIPMATLKESIILQTKIDALTEEVKKKELYDLQIDEETRASLKGDKGEKGDKGDKGERGEKGDNGKNGKDGKDGKDGVNGKDGRDGINGKNGKDGRDGKDAEFSLKDGVIPMKAVKDLDRTIITMQDNIQIVHQMASGRSTSQDSGLATKQDTLVSGVNIKTINGNSLLGSGDLVISGVGSLTKGIAEVDFGDYTTYNDIATVFVADTNITLTSYPSVSLYAVATTDHDPDDYMAEGLIPYVTNIQAGVGFDISVRAPSLTWGKYKVSYQY